ncbi:hypothetical protein FRC04_000896 [Tulasnella sp. 424]|nr:hypothetical protein FRC04_000896 [Tulasnella sp. 424]
MPWTENTTLPLNGPLTSRFFANSSKPPPSGTSNESDSGFNKEYIPKTPPRTRPLPRAQVEVVIPPYRPQRKPAPPAPGEEPHQTHRNTLSLSKFAYVPPKTPTRRKPVVVPVAPQAPPTTSRFFAKHPTVTQKAVTTPTLYRPALPKSSDANEEPQTPMKKRSRKRKASDSLPTDLNNGKKVKLDICASLVADDPWMLIIATSLLNKTRGALSIPIFWEIMRTWPTPKQLATASPAILSQIMVSLGLQNSRARRFVKLSLEYLKNPPSKDRVYKSRCPTRTPKKRRSRKLVTPEGSPKKRTRSTTRKKEIVPERDESNPGLPKESPTQYPPTPISHLPGAGKYALDSYRIFSPMFCGGGAPRDEQRCLQNLLLTRDETNESTPEWREVLPEDKELRKYLVSLL